MQNAYKAIRLLSYVVMVMKSNNMFLSIQRCISQCNDMNSGPVCEPNHSLRKKKAELIHRMYINLQSYSHHNNV